MTEMHLKMVCGKPLYVGLAERREQRMARLQQRFRSGPPGMGGMGMGGQGGYPGCQFIRFGDVSRRMLYAFNAPDSFLLEAQHSPDEFT